MAELRSLLIAVVLGAVWSRGSTSGSFPESVAVERPQPSSFSMPSCVKSSVTVRFYEITVEGSDSDAVYRRTTVYDDGLTFVSNETIDFNATDLNKCAKAVSAEGLAAFFYNGSCMGYRPQISFLSCATDGEVVLYVRTDHLTSEAPAVPFDQAPKRLIDDGFQPYHMFMVRDVLLLADGKNAILQPLFKVEDTFITAPREDGLFLNFLWIYLDAKNCFTDVYSVPVYMTDSTAQLASQFIASTARFLDECGKTIEPDISRGVGFMVYSHAGLGCTHYPADAPDECTVTFHQLQPLEFGLFMLDDHPECGGFELKGTAWSTTSTETETIESCEEDGTYRFNRNETFDMVTISILRRPSMPNIGFYIYFD